MFRRDVVAALVAVGLSVALGAEVAHADTALLRQVKSQQSCLLSPTKRVRLAVCGANYVDVLLAVNRARVTYPVAVGIAHARHTTIEVCRCGASRVLVTATTVSKYTRRRFADWWKRPGTRAGDRLKGCLKNAALALGASLALYWASGGKRWSDSDVIWSTAVACGIGAVVDA